MANLLPLSKRMAWIGDLGSSKLGDQLTFFNVKDALILKKSSVIIERKFRFKLVY